MWGVRYTTRKHWPPLALVTQWSREAYARQAPSKRFPRRTERRTRLVVDELTSWPQTRNYTSLWTAIVSALPKRPDSRLIVLSMAGSPTHFAAKIWALALMSDDWRATSIPGPCEWWADADIASTRTILTPLEFRRYVLAEWVDTDETLSAAEHVQACVRADRPVLPPQAGVSYVAGLDIGTRRDLSALVVAHAGQTPSGPGAVVDLVHTWRPRGGLLGRVDLDEVEQTVRRVMREYHARLHFDRSQAEQLSQNLTRDGLRVEEYVFSASGVNRLAKALRVALRDHALSLPDDEELITELTSARLVETGPGLVKMVNPGRTHDDAAAALGMCLVHLLDHPSGVGSIGGPEMASRSLLPETPSGDVSALRRDAASLVGWGRSWSSPVTRALDDRTEGDRWTEVVAVRRGGHW
jgi:hypothetical protein